MTDHIEKLLKAKREGRKSMEAGRARCRTVASRAKWTRWIKKNDEEIAALESAQKQLAGLRAVKSAHKKATSANDDEILARVLAQRPW